MLLYLSYSIILPSRQLVCNMQATWPFIIMTIMEEEWPGSTFQELDPRTND